MRKFIGLLLLFLAFSGSSLMAGNDKEGAGSAPEEIYLITLDQLFTQAGKQWNVESDELWEDYSEKEVKVKLLKKEQITGLEEYEVASVHYGTLVLKVNAQDEKEEEIKTDDVNLSEFFNDSESNLDESE